MEFILGFKMTLYVLRLPRLVGQIVSSVQWVVSPQSGSPNSVFLVGHKD